MPKQMLGHSIYRPRSSLVGFSFNLSLSVLFSKLIEFIMPLSHWTVRASITMIYVLHFLLNSDRTLICHNLHTVIFTYICHN